MITIKDRQKLTLEQRVLRFIQEHRLISSHRPLLVAVSGGPDSVCLLHILADLKDKLGARLHVAHLNHQLRGAESEADAEYVSALARRLDIPATIEQRDVKGYQAQAHVSLEEAAREVRYTFLAQVAKYIGADRTAGVFWHCQYILHFKSCVVFYAGSIVRLDKTRSIHGPLITKGMTRSSSPSYIYPIFNGLGCTCH